MSERHINLKAWEVRAILEGRKTQTRRIVDIKKACGSNETHDSRGRVKLEAEGWRFSAGNWNVWSKPCLCPYGQEGDRLWVRETWGLMPTQHEWEKWVVYQADRMAHRAGMADDQNVHHRPINRLDEWTPRIWAGDDPKWRSSIHMPRWASRITLEVTGVRLERLQDISARDAIAEGIPIKKGSGMIEGEDCYMMTTNSGYMRGPLGAIASYKNLWESINGPGSWDANPWVWVVEFKRVQEGGEV